MSRAILIVSALSFFGCGDTGPEGILALNGATSPITVKVGQVMQITLQTVGPGHYEDPTISSSAVTFIGTVPPDFQPPAGPRQVFQFEAASSGQASISIKHTGGIGDTPPFQMTIVVK